MKPIQMRISEAKKKYIAAGERLNALNRHLEEVERLYLMAHGIKNSDGSTPCKLQDIDDANTFDSVSRAFADTMGALYAECGNAYKTFISAEQSVIRCGLDLVPESARAALKRDVKRNSDARQTLIGLVLRLDSCAVS